VCIALGKTMKKINRGERCSQERKGSFMLCEERNGLRCSLHYPCLMKRKNFGYGSHVIWKILLC
jgi:hypothetical protein